MKLFGVFAFACLAQSCLSYSLTSYEGFKVLRVQVADRDAAERLHKIGDDTVEFWSDLPGRHADLMVSPDDLDSIAAKLNGEGFEYRTMIENVAGNNINVFEKKLSIPPWFSIQMKL